MFFAQKVYYNNKPLVLTNDKRLYLQNQPLADGYLALTGAFSRNYRIAFEHLGKLASTGSIIEDISDKALRDELYAFYTPVDAGGGVVVNEDNEVLMIFRRGKWDLPKGKRDDNEDIADCAVREVSEETGLRQLNPSEKICDTYHVYSQNGQNLLKCTTWYKMYGTKQEKLIPQKEENILEAKWIAEKDLGAIVLKSYEAIKEVLTEAGFKW